MATLMILGAGLSQRPMYEAAHRRGLTILGADPDPEAPALGLAHDALVCDLADVDTLLQAARHARIAGALTFAADYPMTALARVWAELGLKGPTEAAVWRATHKGEMRATFQRAGVPSPASICVRSAAELWAEAQRQGGNLIVKPAQSSGGRGVTALPPGCDERIAAQAYGHAAGFTRDRCSVLLEQYVDGAEYSIESVIFDGRHQVVAITEKLTTGVPHCVEIGHHQPASISDSERAALCEVAAQAVAALGVDHAVCHSEAKLTPQGPVVIECAARAGGGFITSHLVPLSTGIDLMDAAIQIALGQPPALRALHQGQPVAIRSIIGRPGRISAMQGIEQVRAMAGVVDVRLYKRVGDEVAVLRDATARCGHVIAVGADVESAIACATAARDAVAVITDPA